MITWIIVVGLAAVLCYLSDAGILPILREPIPFFRGSVISIVLMLISIVMLLRTTRMSKRREKEELLNRISELEDQLDKARSDISPRAKALAGTERNTDE